MSQLQLIGLNVDIDTVSIDQNVPGLGINLYYTTLIDTNIF